VLRSKGFKARKRVLGARRTIGKGKRYVGELKKALSVLSGGGRLSWGKGNAGKKRRPWFAKKKETGPVEKCYKKKGKGRTRHHAGRLSARRKKKGDWSVGRRKEVE